MRKNNILVVIFSLIFILFLSGCNDLNNKNELNVFENIEFKDQEFIYDSKYHSIYVSNVPDFAIDTYQGNEQKEIGEYIVIATIK